MVKTPICEVFVDGGSALNFVMNSPWHGVVIGRITSALEKCQIALDTALRVGNAGLHREISLVARFLKGEASDRVNIKFEYLVVDAFDSLYGAEAVDALLDHQTQYVLECERAEWAAVPKCLLLEREFEAAGLGWAPNWGREAGKANISQLTRVRLARHHLFNLTSEMHLAYRRGARQEAINLKLRCQDARRLIGPLANIECKSKALTAIKSLYGADTSQAVLSWVKANTQLPEYEASRDAIQAFRLEGCA